MRSKEGGRGEGRVAVLTEIRRTPRPFESTANRTEAEAVRSETLRALIRHSRVPLDLVSAGAELPSQKEAVEALFASLGASEDRRDVRVVSPAFMARELADGRYRLIHDAFGCRPGLGCHLRDRFARNPVACVSTFRGFSKMSEWLTEAFPAILPGSRPYDAVLCADAASESFLRRLLASLAEGSRVRLGDAAGFRGRFVQAPLGVDTERFRPRDRSEARDRLGLPSDAIVFYRTGRLDPETNGDLIPLLKATAEIRNARPDVEFLLLIAGSGDAGYVRYLKAMISRFDLARTVDLRTDIPAFAESLLYDAVDVFIGGSDAAGESCESAVLEAMASGLPVIAPDWGGDKEAVVDGETGFRIPTTWARCDEASSATALLYNEREILLQETQSVAVDFERRIEAMTALLLNPDLRREMGERGRERAVRRHAWETVVRRYEEIWTDLSERAGSDAEVHPDGVYPLIRPSEVFRSHPTEFVTEETPIRLSQLGAECLRGKMRVSPDAMAEPYLDSELLERLHRSAGKRAAFKAAPIRRILEGVVGSGEADRAEGLRHLMWLLKYDLLEAAGGEPAAR